MKRLVQGGETNDRTECRLKHGSPDLMSVPFTWNPNAEHTNSIGQNCTQPAEMAKKL